MLGLSRLWRGIRQGVTYPKLFAREANRFYHRSFYRHEYNVDGVDVFDEDWDSLIVLDGCRYDLFERRHDLPGRLESRRSRGSHTVEFLVGNVAERSLHDTVYVTASPQFHRWQDRLNAEFHRVIDVWDVDGWDPQHHTVLPETTTAVANEAARRHPEKRLLVHYLQPHYPFIDADDAVNPRRFGDVDGSPDIWALLNRGAAPVSGTTVLEAYERNFDRVLPAVAELMSAIDGRTIVTSDHGNLLGEREVPLPIREWGHPPGLYLDELVRVPWLVFEDGPRRTVTADPPVDPGSNSRDSLARERLTALGYAE